MTILRVADTDRGVLDGFPLPKGVYAPGAPLGLRNNSTAVVTPIQYRQVGNPHPSDGSMRAVTFFVPPLASTSDDYELVTGAVLPKYPITMPTHQELKDMLSARWVDNENGQTCIWTPRQSWSIWPNAGYMREYRYVGGFEASSGYHPFVWAEALVRKRFDTDVLHVWLRIVNCQPWGFQRGTRLARYVAVQPFDGSTLDHEASWTANYHAADSSKIVIYNNTDRRFPFPLFQNMSLCFPFYVKPGGGSITAADKLQPALWQDATTMVGWHGDTAGYVGDPQSGDTVFDVDSPVTASTALKTDSCSSVRRTLLDTPNDSNFILWSGNPPDTQPYTLNRLFIRYQIQQTSQTGFPRHSHRYQPDVAQLVQAPGGVEKHYTRMLQVAASQVERGNPCVSVWSQGQRKMVPFAGFAFENKDRYEDGHPRDNNGNSGASSRDKESMFNYKYGNWDAPKGPPTHDLRRYSNGPNGGAQMYAGDFEHDNLPPCYQAYLREGCLFFRDAILRRGACRATYSQMKGAFSDTTFVHSGRTMTYAMDFWRLGFILSEQNSSIMDTVPGWWLECAWRYLTILERGKGKAQAEGAARNVFTTTSPVTLPSSGSTVLSQFCDLYGGNNGKSPGQNEAGSSFTPWMVSHMTRACLMLLQELESTAVGSFPGWAALRDSIEEGLEHTLFTIAYACYDPPQGIRYKAHPTAGWIDWGTGGGYTFDGTGIWNLVTSYALTEYPRWDAAWWSANADRIALDTRLRSSMYPNIWAAADSESWANPVLAHSRTV